MTIRITGSFTVPADKRDRIGPALDAHRALSRADPGCLRFDVWPDPASPGRYLVDEVFTDQASFDAHVARVKSSVWWTVSADFVRNYRIDKPTGW